MSKTEDVKKTKDGLRTRTHIKSGSVNPYSACGTCKHNCSEDEAYWECIAVCEKLACA